MSLKQVKFMSKVVLIVDDEDMIHELLTIHLQRLQTPIEVFSARTGLEAIDLYRSLMDNNRTPDLVVMDLNLAGEENMEAIENHKAGGNLLDGVRTTHELLKLDPNVRIWGYTAWFETDWSKDLEQYADRIIERTIPFHEFAKMVDRLFSGQS
jgi:DNA-binding NarL/FixJ family response regulator